VSLGSLTAQIQKMYEMMQVIDHIRLKGDDAALNLPMAFSLSENLYLFDTAKKSAKRYGTDIMLIYQNRPVKGIVKRASLQQKEHETSGEASGGYVTYIGGAL